MQMDRKVKTAVVGCGMISNIYIKNFKNLFHVIDLVAVGNRSLLGPVKAIRAFGAPADDLQRTE